MSNLKSRVIGKANLTNKTNYNSFDLSHRNCFTNSTGAILPVAVNDVLPTEKISLNIGWFTRAQTIISNSYGRFVENVQAFYIPYSAIYRNYSQNALTSSLSNAKGDNECRISDGLAVTQPLNDGRLPSILLSDIWEYLFFQALYEMVYVCYLKKVGTFASAPDNKLLSRTYMTRSLSQALLLESLGYGSFELFTNPNYRIEYELPLSMQDLTDGNATPLTISAIDTAKIQGTAFTATTFKQWWKKQRNAYDIFVSPMRLAAYHKVYNDYYRNDTWQPYESDTCNLDYLFKTQNKKIEIPWSSNVTSYSSQFDEKIDSVIDALFVDQDAEYYLSKLDELNAFFEDDVNMRSWFTDYNIFDVRACNLPLDAVNGVLPEPQYGTEAVVDITQVNSSISASNFQPMTGNNSQELIYHGKTDSPVQGNTKLGVRSSSGIITPASLSFSVRDMRIAESLQKYKEISISNDNYFVNQLKAHFGESPIYDPFKTYFIGGKSSIMQVDTQVNTNLADDNNATLGGLASAQGNFTANYKADDYGCVIVLHSIYPLVDYPNDGIEESLLCTTARELPVPEFDNNGFEGVRNIYVRGCDPKNYTNLTGDDSKPLGVYGYGARYWSWKTAKDVVNGDFKYTLRDKVMGFNSLNSKFGLVENTLLATPKLTDQIFANQHHSNLSDDQFYTNMQVGVSMMRPFSVHGLPFAN